MNTQCPHCRTVFRVQASELEIASGRVRCGHCRRVFNARQRLQRELPLARSRNSGSQSSLAFGQPRASVSGLLLSDLGEEGPGRSRRSAWSLAGWATVNALLVILLLGQLVYAQRDVFAQDPSLRPLLLGMCEPIGCALPPRRDVARIELVRRSVYSHPNAEDALIIDATFVNNAPFAQPHPVLTVSLGDVRGEPLIRRNFQPHEYLPELDGNQRMAPGSPVRVTLEVRDPGRAVRTFELDFS